MAKSKCCKDCKGPGPFRTNSHQCVKCYRTYQRAYSKAKALKGLYVVGNRLVIGVKPANGIYIGIPCARFPVGDYGNIRGFKSI